MPNRPACIVAFMTIFLVSTVVASGKLLLASGWTRAMSCFLASSFSRATHNPHRNKFR